MSTDDVLRSSPMATGPATNIGVLVGRTLQALRSKLGLTQEEAARVIRARGFAWTRAQIAALESGRRPDVGLGELAVLSAAFGVQLVDWLPTAGTVDLGAQARCDVGSLRAWAVSGPPPALEAPVIEDPENIRDWGDLATVGRLVPSEAEIHAAKRLGITGRGVHRVSTQLWEGRGLDEERARRLAALAQPATAAYRGHVTRELLAELRAAPGLAKERRG